jgi:hypothetical protein
MSATAIAKIKFDGCEVIVEPLNVDVWIVYCETDGEKIDVPIALKVFCFLNYRLQPVTVNKQMQCFVLNSKHSYTIEYQNKEFLFI